MEHIIVLNDTMIDKQSFRWKIGVNQPPSFLLKRVHPVKDFFDGCITTLVQHRLHMFHLEKSQQLFYMNL